MKGRSKAREVALYILYQIDITKSNNYLQAFHNYLENNPQPEPIKNFCLSLLEGVANNLSLLDSLIKKYTEHWEIKRMAVIDRNILRMASFELLFLEDIPPKVSINEAVELAKNFGDINSPRFVNGVLDKIYKSEVKNKGKIG